MFASMFEFECTKRNFFILKSTKGKGFFNLFIASTFLIGTDVQNIVVCIGFAICGLFFLYIGFKYGELDNPKDITKGDMAKSAYDNRSLLGQPKVEIGVSLK
eukprot:403335880